jgi:ABC-type Fe3+ transport system substrate-binding protein
VLPDFRAVRGMLLVVALAACAPGPAPRAEPPRSSPQGSAPLVAAPTSVAPLQEMVEAARKEGKLALSWGASVVGGSETVQRWSEGFNRLYGLNLEVQWTPGPQFDALTNQIVVEYQAGRPATTDVLINSDANVLPLLDAGAVLPADWTRWAPNVQDPRLVAANGAAVAFAVETPGILFNTNNVPPQTAPRGLRDLLKPEFKGRVATTPNAFGFNRLASDAAWGEQQVVTYVSQLADQVGGLIQCGQTDRVASGEFDLFAYDCGSYLARRWQARGAPVQQVIPEDGAFIGHWYMSVPRHAAHPAAAQLWVNYVLSPEAQAIMYDVAYIGSDLAEGSPVPQEIAALKASGIKFLEVDVEYFRQNSRLGPLAPELARLLQK